MLALFKIKKIRIPTFIGKFIVLPTCSIIKFKIQRLKKRHCAVNFKRSVGITVYCLILLEHNTKPVKSGIFNLYFPNYLFTGGFPVTAANVIDNLLIGA